MSKQTRGKKNSWRGKAMAALALSAVFGLSAGAALAATTDVDVAGDLSNSITNADDIFNITGTIDAGDTAMSNGQLNVGGKLIIGGPAGAAGDLAFADGTQLTFTGGLIKAKEIVFGKAAGDTLNLVSDATKAIGIYIGGSAPAPASDNGPVGVISADKLTYNPSGSAWQPKNTTIYLADGGTFTMTPDNAANPLGGHPMNTETLMGSDNNSLVMTGGTLDMNGGGEVTIGGNFKGVSGLYEYAALYGNFDVDNRFDIYDGVINLKDWGSLGIYGDAPANAGSYNLNIWGGTINMDGSSLAKASVIRASSDSRAEDYTTGYYSNVRISDHGTINVGADKYGAIISRYIDMYGGTINVDGTLVVAGSLAFNSDAEVDVLADIRNATDWGNFSLSGGNINIGATGLIYMAAEDLVLSYSGGALKGTLALLDNDTEFSAAAAAALDKGALYVSEVDVEYGTLTVDALDLSGLSGGKGQIEVFDDASLVVTGTTTFGGTDTLILNDNSSLTANFADFLTNAYALASASVADALKIAATTANSIIYLRGNSGTYDQDDLDAVTALLDDSGNDKLTVAFLGGLMEEVEDLGSDDGNASIETGVIASNNDLTATVNAPTATLDNEVTGSTLKVKNSTAGGAVTDLTLNANLTLTGTSIDNSGSLVADADGKPIDLILNKGAGLNLGIAGNADEGQGQGGTVGNIEINTASGEGGNVNVNDGDYSTGDITFTGGNSSDEYASITVQNADLSTKAISDGGTASDGDINITAQSDSLKNFTNEGIDLTENIGNVVIGLTNYAMDTKGGDIVFGDGDTYNHHSLVMESGTLNSGNIEFGSVDNGWNELVLTDTNATVGDITFGAATNGGRNYLDVIGGSLTAGIIDGNDASIASITVGDNDAAGHLEAETVKNSTIILDPAWATGNGPSTAIIGAIELSSLAVLQNSWAMITGANKIAEAEKWMAEQIPGGELTQNGYTAALALVAPMKVDGDNNYLVLDGSLTSADVGQGLLTNGNVAFMDQSLLLIDAGATLKVVGGGVDDVIKILAGFTSITPTGWAVNNTTPIDNLLTDSALLWAHGTRTGSGADNGFQVKLERNDYEVTDIFPKISSGLEEMVESILTTTVTKNDPAGLQYIDRLFRGIGIDIDGSGKLEADELAGANEYGVTASEAARTLEGAARLAVAAGAPTIANNVIGKVSSLIVDHNNFLNDVQPAYGSEAGGLGLWVTPFYGASDIDGQDAGSFESGQDINYGGAAFGLDYNISEAFRLGLALNVGGGDSESQGDFNKTENDFDFFGVSLYGSYTDGAFGLTGDVGYTAVDNDIEQTIRDIGFGSRLSANVDSDAFTAGLTGQYRFTTGSTLAITPHLGLRYTAISTDDANIRADRARFLDVETDDQNLFQIPLGVKFSGDMATDGGWTVTPSADLGVLFTMGDTDIDSKLRIPGAPAGIPIGRTNTDAVDSVAFTGALGIQAKADNGISLGLEYGLLASGNQTDHSVSGLLRFDF